MDELQDKWGEKYSVVIDSWRRNWDRLATYFRYDKSIRKLIYTTNTIEGFHRQVRKVTKTKGAFTSDMALLKLIYLAHKKTLRRNGRCHWPIGEQPHKNWPFGSHRENGVRFAVAIRVILSLERLRITPSLDSLVYTPSVCR